MVKVQEQIIAITGSVNFKPEKLFIKQHIRTYQSVSVHSVQNRCFITEPIVSFLKYISVVIHKQTGFQIRMRLNSTVNGFCQPVQIHLVIKL